ncbi:MAG: YjfB family protein [Lachnospiraceae bacterium]|nr:YjfB family protein [Lachnospiraceae bacterium]
MDIAGMSTAMSQSQLMTNIGTAMLSKNLDTLKDMGNAMTQTMDAMPSSSPSLESLVNPAVGGNIDILV